MKQLNVIEIMGKNLRRLRKKKKISLEELAKKVNIDVEELRKFETGESAKFGPAGYTKIVRQLGVELDEITKGLEFVEE